MLIFSTPLHLDIEFTRWQRRDFCIDSTDDAEIGKASPEQTTSESQQSGAFFEILLATLCSNIGQ